MAVIKPYDGKPNPVPVGVLQDNGVIRDVDSGQQYRDHGNCPREMRVYGSWSTVARLMQAEQGEALLWAGEAIRWRQQRLEQKQWVAHPGDVTVLKMEFPPGIRETEMAFRNWAAWLWRQGALPQRSLGYSGFSLLRATLTDTLVTMAGEPPPFNWIQGARQQLFVEPRTEIRDAIHLDLPAAYPRRMGLLPVGKMLWRHLEGEALTRVPLETRGLSAPLFVRALVTLPEGLKAGPLPERPQEAPVGSWERCEILGGTEVASYPTSGWLEGTWCWEELVQAMRAGAEIAPIEAWVGVGDGTRPFLGWLEACEAGRRLPGFASQLAKATANGTWGQLVVRADQPRVLAWFDGTVLQQRRLPALKGGLPPSWDLGELICGGVRAHLARLIRELSFHLVSVHTDGGWVFASAADRVPDGFLIKDRASRLQIIDPQCLRYQRPATGKWLYRVAGSPATRAPWEFEQAWTVDRKVEA